MDSNRIKDIDARHGTQDENGNGARDATMRKMALCAMAEAIGYFDAAQNGQGGLRYASVGTVSVSGKGIYSQVDISAAAQEKELYRTASRYLQIYRGIG